MSMKEDQVSREERIPVQGDVVKRICLCGGELVVTSESPSHHVFAGKKSEVTYQHKCNKCGRLEMLESVYPYITWVWNGSKN